MGNVVVVDVFCGCVRLIGVVGVLEGRVDAAVDRAGVVFTVIGEFTLSSGDHE